MNKSGTNVFTKKELLEAERRFGKTGVATNEIIAFCTEHGVAMSEPTLRKYIQHFDLPRARRIGFEGKHRGSQGRYPHYIIEAIGLIKAVADHKTLKLSVIRDSPIFLLWRLRSLLDKAGEIIGLVNCDNKSENNPPAVTEKIRRVQKLLIRSIKDLQTSTGGCDQ